MYRSIKNFSQYQVNELGDVMSFNRGKILKPQLGSNGYLQVNLYKDGKLYSKLLHRLVAEAFIPNPECKETVDHINGDKTDNRVENLRWATRKEQASFENHFGHSTEKEKARMRKVAKTNYQKNKEAKLSYAKIKYQANREAILAYQKERYQKLKNNE